MKVSFASKVCRSTYSSYFCVQLKQAKLVVYEEIKFVCSTAQSKHRRLNLQELGLLKRIPFLNPNDFCTIPESHWIIYLWYCS